MRVFSKPPVNPVNPKKRNEMIKKIEEYEEYQDCLKEIEKQRVRCENLTKVFEELERVSLNLDNTLGMDKSGQLPDFNKISKSKEKTKIAKREVDIANEKLHSLEEYLKEKILEIKELRRDEARKVGLKINKKVIKTMRAIEKLIEDYKSLEKDIDQDLSERDRIDRGDVKTIIGPDPTFVDFSSKMAYPTEFFLKRSKIYQSKKEKEKDEVKDI